MRFTLKRPLGKNIHNLIREIGYFFQKKDIEKLKMAFLRPAKGYPRFHLFLKIDKDNLIFNLHLDQKKPSYKSFTAHSGEYKSKIVVQEAERIKKILQIDVKN